MKIHDYLSPAEFRRLVSALMAVIGFISLVAFFGFIVVPGFRYQAHTSTESPVQAVQGETGWLDPTDYPATVRQVIPPIDPKTVMTPNPELMARGKALFAQNCATCHGPEGKGDGPGGAGLTPKPRNFTQPDAWVNGHQLESIYQTLDEGIKGSSMVSYKDLSKRDRMALAHVIQSFCAFGPAPSDPKALAALEALCGSAGEIIPNRIPVARAVDALCREYATAQAEAPATARH